MYIIFINIKYIFFKQCQYQQCTYENILVKYIIKDIAIYYFSLIVNIRNSVFTAKTKDYVGLLTRQSSNDSKTNVRNVIFPTHIQDV